MIKYLKYTIDTLSTVHKHEKFNSFVLLKANEDIVETEGEKGDSKWSEGALHVL